ncbi:ROK family protein [Bacterioplanoides pacificum]|uniref:ROK family protein n=1 Tax=Bacterioplanoides pacificum TaxID=1171596 RepID=A0ABV7VWR1_9GAMM
MTAATPLQFGIDLGGTKTEIIVMSASGDTLLRQRNATPAHHYDAIVANIVSLVQQAQQQLPGDYTLGLGIPGAISPTTGLVKNANTTCLIGRDLQRDLEQALAQPLVIANDADCFALSEATDGAAAGKASVFAVIIGTGCGGGWVINGQLINGPNAIAGEWGHNPLLWRDDQDAQTDCYCGQRGCLETLLSGPGMRQQAYLETAIDQSSEQWFTQYQQQNPIAQQVFQRYHRRLAKALAGIINILDPHAIVLGGGVSNLDSIYQQVPQLWQEFVFSDSVSTPLLKAKHGDSSGVRGAAWLGAGAAHGYNTLS